MPSSSDNSSSIHSFNTTLPADNLGPASSSTWTASAGRRDFDPLFIAILLAYACYIALFIWRSSFVVDGVRYFSLFDDAMISMRYAKNLASGEGLIWNAGGERIEGITNPLWTMMMAAYHLLPVAPSKISLLVQITSGLMLIANLFFVRRIADALSGGSRFVALTSVLFTAFYLSLNTWSLLGMEVGLLTLLLSAAVWTTIRTGHEERFSPLPYLLLGIGTLVRLDMAVPFLAILAFNVWNDRSHRSRHLWSALPLLALLLIAQTTARWFYYGDLLPNTYYLKMTGYPIFWRIMRGLLVLMKFIWQMNWLVFLVAVVGGIIWRSRATSLLLALVVGQMLYSVYVGGDAWETWGGANRYISIAMPGLFILFAYGIAGIVAWLKEGLGDEQRRVRLIGYGTAIVLVLSFANVNAIHGFYAWPRWAFVWPTLNWGENRDNVRWAQVVERVTMPGATVAVSGAGVSPYFFDRPAIDLLGKSDRVVAHEPMRTTTGMERFTYFYPGHLKWNYDYSIGRLRPDAIIHLPNAGDAARWIERDYQLVIIDGRPIYLRRDSPLIRWDRVDRSETRRSAP